MSIKILFVILYVTSQAKTKRLSKLFEKSPNIKYYNSLWVSRPLDSILFFLDGKAFNKSYIIKYKFGSKFKKNLITSSLTLVAKPTSI